MAHLLINLLTLLSAESAFLAGLPGVVSVPNFLGLMTRPLRLVLPAAVISSGSSTDAFLADLSDSSFLADFSLTVSTAAAALRFSPRGVDFTGGGSTVALGVAAALLTFCSDLAALVSVLGVSVFAFF